VYPVSGHVKWFNTNASQGKIELGAEGLAGELSSKLITMIAVGEVSGDVDRNRLFYSRESSLVNTLRQAATT